MSLRLTSDIEQRLEACAGQVKLSKNALAQAAIEAAVEAIEKNGGKLVLPLEFAVTHEAVPKTSAPTVKKMGPDTTAKIVRLPSPPELNQQRVAEETPPYGSLSGTNP